MKRILFICILIPVALSAQWPPGDVNNDGALNLGDGVYLILYIFYDGLAPEPLETGDYNCDGAVNLGDVSYLIDYIFRSGPPPCGTPSGYLIDMGQCKPHKSGAGTDSIGTGFDCVTYQYDGNGTLDLTHINAALNCCPEIGEAVITIEEGMIIIDETPIDGVCDCICLFDLDYRIVNLPPGTYLLVFEENYLLPDDTALTCLLDLTTTYADTCCIDRGYGAWEPWPLKP